MDNSKSLKKVLLVDDESNFVTQFKYFLESRGYEVVFALHAAAALDLLKQQEVAVVLTDQRMPGMKGVEFLARVQKDYPDVIRVLITGYSDLNDVIHAVNQGAIYRYISKTALPEEIALMVDQCFEKFEQDQEIKRLSRANRRLLRMLAAEKNLSACGIFGQEVSQKLEAIVLGLSGYLFKRAGQKNPQELGHDFQNLEASLRRIRELSQTISLIDEPASLTENLNALMEEEVGRAKFVAMKEGMYLQFYFDLPILPRVAIASRAFKRALKEILENAVLFSPLEQKQIFITARVVSEKEDPRLELSFRNQSDLKLGPDMKKYFVPFYTSLGNISFTEQDPIPEIYNFGKSHHYGLGLALAQWLICSAGGEIQLFQKGNEVTIQLTLPLSEGVS